MLQPCFQPCLWLWVHLFLIRLPGFPLDAPATWTCLELRIDTRIHLCPLCPDSLGLCLLVRALSGLGHPYSWVFLPEEQPSLAAPWHWLCRALCSHDLPSCFPVCHNHQWGCDGCTQLALDLRGSGWQCGNQGLAGMVTRDLAVCKHDYESIILLHK